MGLSSFNAMRARERARIKLENEAKKSKLDKVETKPIVETESTSENVSDGLIDEAKVEKKKTDAEKLKKKGV